MTDKINGWIGFLAGLLVGTAIGGIMVYIILSKEAQTTIKTFAYDDAGRLIQVMRQAGI